VGSVIWALLMWGLQAIAATQPIELDVYLPDGAPSLYEVSEVVVLTHRAGKPIGDVRPTLQAENASIIGTPTSVEPGRWAFQIQANQPAPISLTARANRTTFVLELPPPKRAMSGVAGPNSIVGQVGSPVFFALEDNGAPRATMEQIQVHVAEGVAEIVDGEAGTLSVRWTPTDSLFPRAVPIAIRDLRTPRLAPAWTVVKLNGRPRIPIHTEPGVAIELRIGERQYGPWTSDENGEITARPEVRPGERVAVLTAKDALGNEETSEISLGADVRARISLVPSGAVVPGRSIPYLWVHAIRASGAFWQDAKPVCNTTAGEPLELVQVGLGTWRAEQTPSADVINLRIRCSLPGGAFSSARIPVATDIPTRLVFRAYPERLTADLPVAEVQAYLVNAAGDRLSSERISMRATHGEIQLDPLGLGRDLRGVYQGQRAAVRGFDVLIAGADLPPGKGGVWSIDVMGAAPQGKDRLLVNARARDRLGRPLVDVPIVLTAAGRTAEIRTNGRGWAVVELPWPEGGDVAVIEAVAGGITRRAAVFPGDASTLGSSIPDLRSEVSIQIVAGRIRNMILTAEPRILESGGARGRVVIRLEDGAGNAVVDQPVEVVASVGEVGVVQARNDGSFEAFFTPPPNLPATVSRITASSPDGRYSASTDLQIVPRRYRQALGVHVGGLMGRQRTNSPYAAIAYDLRLPLEPFIMRVSAGYYQMEAESFDELAAQSMRMQMRMLPLSLGLLARREAPVFPSWVGAELAVAPHRMETWLGDKRVTGGLDITPPGFRVLTGLGWRTRVGELQTELGYLFLYGTRTGIGWNGPIGGVVGTLGYKVLY
jgi:hypothetical protein